MDKACRLDLNTGYTRIATNLRPSISHGGQTWNIFCESQEATWYELMAHITGHTQFILSPGTQDLINISRATAGLIVNIQPCSEGLNQSTCVVLAGHFSLKTHEAQLEFEMAHLCL